MTARQLHSVTLSVRACLQHTSPSCVAEQERIVAGSPRRFKGAALCTAKRAGREPRSAFTPRAFRGPSHARRAPPSVWLHVLDVRTTQSFTRASARLAALDTRLRRQRPEGAQAGTLRRLALLAGLSRALRTIALDARPSKPGVERRCRLLDALANTTSAAWAQRSSRIVWGRCVSLRCDMAAAWARAHVASSSSTGRAAAGRDLHGRDWGRTHASLRWAAASRRKKLRNEKQPRALTDV